RSFTREMLGAWAASKHCYTAGYGQELASSHMGGTHRRTSSCQQRCGGRPAGLDDLVSMTIPPSFSENWNRSDSSALEISGFKSRHWWYPPVTNEAILGEKGNHAIAPGRG